MNGLKKCKDVLHSRILALAISATARSQDSTAFSFTFNHLAISVKDVDRSAEFYKNVLHLKEIDNRGKFESVRWFSTGDGVGKA